MKTILPPHLKPGQKVKDPATILREARDICKGMQNGSFVTPSSKYNNCFAMAQPQVSNKPLRYFVINPITASQVAKDFGGLVIINPRIIEKDKSSKVMSLEGCMSYPFRPAKKVKRYGIITVTYDVIEDLKNPNVVHVESREIKGFTSFVCLHELEHLNGKSIFTN
jgi:peptide deformylase